MKKRIFAGLLASATVLGVFVAGGTALAAEKDSYDTEVGIGFSAHTPPPGTDPLTIQWAPISFDFGSTNTVNTAAVSFSETSGANRYVVVKDGRAESGSDKWELTAKLSDMKDGSVQLTGATLSFDAVKKAYMGTGPEAPEETGMIAAPTALHTATVTATQTLAQSATAVKVMDDDGAGTTSHKGSTAMEMTNIKMNVPANAAQSGKQYKGTLTWSLDDTI